MLTDETYSFCFSWLPLPNTVEAKKNSLKKMGTVILIVFYHMCGGLGCKHLCVPLFIVF